MWQMIGGGVFLWRYRIWHWSRDMKALAGVKLNEIPAEVIAGFIEKQREANYEVSSINRALQVLRRAFHLALEWGKVEKLPTRISLVPGERRRDRVLSEGDENAFLKAACEIGDAIIEAHDTGPPSAANSLGGPKILIYCAMSR
jgi:site-specific recombinase XerD